MKFHAYLEGVLGTKAGISTMRQLVKYRGKVYTIRTLAKDAGISSVEASRTVAQLERYGIVVIQPVGRSHQVQLNDKSYLLRKIITPVFTAEDDTLAELRRVLARHLSAKKILSAVIFGSVARGEEGDDSDIDLMVISDDFDYATGAVANAREEVEKTFHTGLSPMVFTKKKLIRKKNEDLVRSILADHVLVAGKELVQIK